MRRTAAALLLVVAAACGKDKAKKSEPAPTTPTAPTATAPAATTPPPDPAAPELKLPLVVRKPGQQWTKTDEMSSHLVVGEGDDQLTIDTERHYVDQYEIVEVDAAGVITKLKATYSSRVDTESGKKAGQPEAKSRQKTSPLDGKSYLAWWEGGALKATHADGSAVSAEELDELTDDLDDVGKASPMDKIMTDHPWKVGVPYAFTADDLAALVAAKGAHAPRPTAMSLTLSAVAGDHAIFDMKSSMKTEGKAELAIDMTGAVTIETTSGRPVLLELHGPAKGNAGSHPVTGTMDGKVIYAYAAP